jgi:hypothetical protein
MRRVFWMALGLGAGATAAVLVSRRMRRAREAIAPAAVAKEARQVVADLGQLIRESVEAGRQAMAEKEAEIRDSIEA